MINSLCKFIHAMMYYYNIAVLNLVQSIIIISFSHELIFVIVLIPVAMQRITVY